MGLDGVKERLLNLEEMFPNLEEGPATTTTAYVHEDLSHTNNQYEKDELYTVLWHACAGPLVNIPHVGDRVFYLPQGHLEQVEAYTNQEFDTQLPKHNLPSQILCRVVYVQLKAELETDEVFAQVTLLPETKEELSGIEEETSRSSIGSHSRSFSKILTASDTSTHGGFSVLKRHADECLPPLDMSQQLPSQELVAKDLHGVEWHFRHVYRGHPKRHLFTTGWSNYVSSKKLVTGDTFVFLRGENGELRVGVRHAMETQQNASSSVISCRSMQLGVLATASHAISTGTMFSVYYRPRMSPSEFLIPYNEYMSSVKNKYSIGLRFRMKFEGEECPKQRIVGTIVGIDDVDPVRWPRSKWRCLTVTWDEPCLTAVRPQRVSPWTIELSDNARTNSLPIQLKITRRVRTQHSSSADSSILDDGSSKNTFDQPPPQKRHSGVLQGQESAISAIELGTIRQPPLAPSLIPNLEWGQAPKKFESGNHLNIQFSPDLCCTVPISSLMPNDFGLNNCTPLSSTYDTRGNTGLSLSNWSVLNEKQNKPESKEMNIVTKSNSDGKCMLFGVDLVKLPNESASPHVISPPEFVNFEQLSVPSKMMKRCDSSNSDGGSEKLLQNCPVTTRSCTKVLKYGTALGRSVDLMKLGGYDELIDELDRMFDFNGALIERSYGWNVIYVDDEGDTMQIGDYPWQEFQLMARKLLICPKEDMDGVNLCLLTIP
ncbi:hypothetical protein MKW98_031639 [Papaver atlanticum]|uniref:Auxin response factor n=1 Tax=Papaver atlanticum TaxID=357466 RepID=A0AAD4S7R4_9MAGN|nr:hypothetical protein MKW98_031639 [Papaver atlanticum]